MVNIFEYTDYKGYLRAIIKNNDLRGYTSRLAEAAGCQKSYFSNVLNTKANLLPDHIFGISDFLKLTEEEREYLILILDYQRANTPAYKKYVHKKIQTRQIAWQDLNNRLQKKSLMTAHDDSHHQNYYSNYLYAALHIAVSIPSLQDTKSLSKFLALPENILQNYLHELEKMALVEKKGSKWLWKSGDLHLAKDSPWIHSHHCNWRLQSIADLSLHRPESLHFSGVQSLSRKDLEHIRFQMTRWIQYFRDTSNPSEPEELVCFNLDLFNLSKT